MKLLPRGLHSPKSGTACRTFEHVSPVMINMVKKCLQKGYCPVYIHIMLTSIFLLICVIYYYSIKSLSLLGPSSMSFSTCNALLAD